MTEWIKRTMIVAAQDVDLARALCGAMSDTDVSGMWVVPLSPTGQLPATHFVSSGPIYPEFAALLGDAQATFDAAGGPVPLAAIEGLYARATIADESVEGPAAIEAAGLRPVAPGI